MSKRRAGATIAMWLAGCTALLMLTSCSAFKAYPGPALPDAEVARLHGYVRYYGLAWSDVEIRDVDGRAPENMLRQAYEAIVTPGRHTFMIKKGTMFLGQTGSRRCSFDLEMEAGHDYYLVPLTFKLSSSTRTDFGWRFKGSIDVEERFSDRSLGTHSLALRCWLYLRVM